jgi:hypothetical protein
MRGSLGYVEQQFRARRWFPNHSGSERMTYQNPNDPTRRTYTDPARPVTNQDLNDPTMRTTTDPADRAAWGMGVTDPPPRSTDSGLRAAWGLGAIFVVMLIVVAVALWNHQSSTSSTATAPSATQSTPNTTGQGSPPNTGAAR